MIVLDLANVGVGQGVGHIAYLSRIAHVDAALHITAGGGVRRLRRSAFLGRGGLQRGAGRLGAMTPIGRAELLAALIAALAPASRGRFTTTLASAFR